MSMSDKSIKTIIDRLNNGDSENIFLQKLSECVEYGIVWHKIRQISPIKGQYYRETREKFYFIKNENQHFVGAVLIMDALDDLHAYILKEHRKQGHLAKAMTKVILPHLFESKEKLRITIDIDRLGEKKYENSKRSALGIGFKEITDYEFHMTRSDITRDKNIDVTKYGITKERLQILTDKMEELSNEIAKIDDEFVMKLGKVPAFDKLTQILKEYSDYKLEDEYWKLIENTK